MKKSTKIAGLALAAIIGVGGACMLTACGGGNDPTPNANVEVLTQGGVKSVLKDGSVLVSYKGQTLQWSKADPTVGRMQDGWWAGIKVIAPTEKFDLEKAVYSAKDDMSNPTSFKDSRDGDNWIGLWGLATEEFMNNETFKEQGYFSYNRYYDWDGDGTYDSHVILRIHTDCTLAPAAE